MPKPVIGILTWRAGLRFKESRYLRQLVKEGRSLNADVFLFSAADINAAHRTIRGYVPTQGGGWSSSIHPWPDIVIDRCRVGGEDYRKVRNSKLFEYANNKYTNKWNATNLFLSTASMRKWMPETVEYSPDRLRSMLKKYSLLYIKPGNGTGGRSIIKLMSLNKSYAVLARSRQLAKRAETFNDESALIDWLNRWVSREKIRDGNFMVQQGLNLAIVPGRVADMRLLIQKDGQGEWKVTGYGIRVGPKGSSTSNLHGGGKAMIFESLIAKRFGEERMETIRKECFDLAFATVETIEQRFGGMMEFGLDIGIDNEGKVWLIEVNPKPGRDIFLGIGRTDLYRKACRMPLQYAIHLAELKHAKRETTG